MQYAGCHSTNLCPFAKARRTGSRGKKRDGLEFFSFACGLPSNNVAACHVRVYQYFLDFKIKCVFISLKQRVQLHCTCSQSSQVKSDHATAAVATCIHFAFASPQGSNSHVACVPATYCCPKFQPPATSYKKTIEQTHPKKYHTRYYERKRTTTVWIHKLPAPP